MFNIKTREKNIKKIAMTSAFTSCANVIIQFIYRTIFLNILTKEYLGIEGLFSNVIQVLSLAELGLGTIISYKLYEPIKNNKAQEVAGLMQFYRKIYTLIAITILVIGFLFLPFLKFLIKDLNEIPSDVNLYLVYLLFLGQSVSSYFFTYKQTLLTADQRGDKVILFNLGITFAKTVIQLLVLVATKKYQIMFVASIIVNIILNGIFSIYITQKYKVIFSIDFKIDIETKNDIFQGAKAMFIHRIGGTVLGVSDNIVMSVFSGLGQLGIYSNYSLIFSNLNKLLCHLLGNFTATIGNAYISLSKEESYKLYNKFLKINLLLANLTAIGIYVFINPFIQLWQGENMVLDKNIVTMLVLSYYLEVARIINTSFTNACGLFKRDILRPIIEASINIIVSIVLAWRYGMIGVFIGTIVSCLLTVWWREPYLLFKYAFYRKIKYYWFEYTKYTLALVLECILYDKVIAVHINY